MPVKWRLTWRKRADQMEVAARNRMWNCGSFIPNSMTSEIAEDVIKVLRVQLRICHSPKHFHANGSQHKLLLCAVWIFACFTYPGGAHGLKCCRRHCCPQWGWKSLSDGGLGQRSPEHNNHGCKSLGGREWVVWAQITLQIKGRYFTALL